ncbi:MAG TPA: N-acetyltransferase [Spirochaetes bacterium]|nr:N-acetyltransferase [Spirochaetota bacterium]
MNTGDITIKETKDADFIDIMDIHKTAFGQDEEAELTAALLGDKSAEPVLSLLAFDGNEAAGHILFTRVEIKGSAPSPPAHILAPLAVKPAFQNRGIGGMLINEGLKRLKEMGAELVFVLGHKEYYPRHGFLPDAGRRGFEAPYPIPARDADAWMVLALTPKGPGGIRGKVRCADVLNRPEYWRE